MLRALFRTSLGAALSLAVGVGCSIAIDSEQYVSASVVGPSPSAGAGGLASEAAVKASFVLLAGQRDDIRNLGAFATDVTLGGFSEAGDLKLWPAWTLPAAGRYVAGQQSGRLTVYGDPEDTNERDALWSSDVSGEGLTPWRRASPPLAVTWAHAVVSETAVIAIAADVGDHVGSDLSLLSLTEPDAWRPSGASLLTPRFRAKASLCHGYLFVVGGEVRPESDPKAIAKVESGAVTAQGVGPMIASTDLTLGGVPLTRTDVTLACGAGRLYVIGGDAEPYMDGGSVQVLSGVIEADGTVMSWDEELKLLYPVQSAAAVVAAGRLIVAGGHNAARLDTVSFAELDAVGHVVAWRAEGNPILPVSLRDAAAVSLELP